MGKVTDVVSSLGFSWWQGGPPHTQSLKDLHWVGGWVAHFETAPRCTTLTFAPQVMETLLFSTFVSWKVFFPLVRDGRGCTYTFMTGASCLDAPPPPTPHVCAENPQFPSSPGLNVCATGGAGEKLLMPGTGFLTLGAASSLAFCQVLREEYPEVACKLNQVTDGSGTPPPRRKENF